MSTAPSWHAIGVRLRALILYELRALRRQYRHAMYYRGRLGRRAVFAAIDERLEPRRISWHPGQVIPVRNPNNIIIIYATDRELTELQQRSYPADPTTEPNG